MYWMMYSPGISPFSSKYIESPNFENDSIPRDSKQKDEKEIVVPSSVPPILVLQITQQQRRISNLGAI